MRDVVDVPRGHPPRAAVNYTVRSLRGSLCLAIVIHDRAFFEDAIVDETGQPPQR